MELKGSKTEQNLWTAFAGESQARNKYDYFASRMRSAYRVQMLAYRAALAALTGIPQSSIQLKLLLVATQTVADIP